MASPFRYDRTWDFDISASELWEVLTRTEQYPRWWAWLRECHLDGAGPAGHADGQGLVPGLVAHCVVRGPLPYTLRFAVRVDEVLPGELLAATVRGDLRGPARLELREEGARCHARLMWEVRVESHALEMMARMARPAMLWAHNRVVESGVREFRAAALAGR